MKNFLAFILCCLILITIKIFCLDIVSISSTSMSPSLWPGEWVIINKLKKPDPGEIITFYSKDYEQIYIKRLITYGESNIAYKDDQVFIDKKLITQVKTQIQDVLPDDMNVRNFKAYKEKVGSREFSILIDENKTVSNMDMKIEENNFFVLGDNRNHSLDSREFGMVSTERIMGVASWVIYRNGSFFIKL